VTAEEVQEKINQGVKEFVDRAAQPDDITLVVVKVE